MGSFPAVHTIGVHRRSSGAEDAHGNAEALFAPPLDEDGEPVQVIGWQVPASTEPGVAGHERVVVDVELGIPVGTVLGPHDVVDLPYGPAGQFEVVGEVRTADGNPFGWTDWPGVVNLKRVDG